MRAIDLAIAIVVTATLAASAFAQPSPCTREEAMQAEATASSLVTWPDILGSFRRFGHCDDGAIAEGYSVSIVGMLSNRWDQVRELDKLLWTDAAFRAFVLRHIGYASQDEFNLLVANAAVRCPRQSSATCNAILKRARELQRQLQRGR